MSESTPWTPGVPSPYYNEDYPGVVVPGVAAAYSYNNENYLSAPGVVAAYSYNNEDYLSAPDVVAAYSYNNEDYLSAPGVAAAYSYNIEDYLSAPGVAAAYSYNNEDYLSAPGVAAAHSYNEDYLSAPGIRFVPTDQELIVKYLQRKLHGEPLPTDVVHDGHDAYAEHPKKLVLKLGEGIEGSWYLFSRRLRKYARGMRPKRAMSSDDGHWKATGRETEIHGGGDEVIGRRRALTFHEDTYEEGSHGRRRRVKGRLASRPTKWKMVEFVCSESCMSPGNAAAADPMLLNEWVLCKITDRSGDEEEHLPDELQQQAGQQQQGAPGGGAASHGNQQAAPAEAPLDDDYYIDDILNADIDVEHWLHNPS